MNSRRVFPPLLKRIGDEILKHLLQVRFAHVHMRQRVERHGRIVLSNGFRMAQKTAASNGSVRVRNEVGGTEAELCGLRDLSYSCETRQGSVSFAVIARPLERRTTVNRRCSRAR